MWQVLFGNIDFPNRYLPAPTFLATHIVLASFQEFVLLFLIMASSSTTPQSIDNPLTTFSMYEDFLYWYEHG